MEERAFKKGDIVVFSDEEFEVLENYGCSGKVREVYGNEIITDFYWSYAGERCKLKAE